MSETRQSAASLPRPPSAPGNRTLPLLQALTVAFDGAIAVLIILAVLLPLYLALKIDYAPTLVSNAIIERTPPDNAIALQNALGALSFPFALMGGIMIMASLGLPVGLLYGLFRKNRALAAGIASLLMPALAFLLFPDHMTPVALVPLLAVGPLLLWLTRRPVAPPAAEPPTGAGLTRRALLQRAAIFSVGGLALSVIDGFPVFVAALNATKPGARLFDFTAPAPRKPEFPAPGGVAEITPAESFYVMRKFPTVVPPVAPDFRLVIDGLVDRPQQLSLDELYKLPRQDTYLTRQCVSNPVGGSLISTAYFSGVPLADLIKTAGIQAGAVQLKFYGRDGYEESVPVGYALAHGLIAYAMNGTALSDAHGAPLKMEIPGLYGFKNMKWLTRIEAIGTPFQSIWAHEGWTETANYKTMSRVDSIAANPAGGTTLCGVAFAGIRSITTVEVQVNGGPWQDALLHLPPLNGQTRVQWRLDIPDRGALTVAVRATDGEGAPQIADKQPQFPDGASGYHTVTVTI
jgi:DMSO/TMAO reductase YedYZ molybdopterin-dependent catalytic subunit